MQAFALPPADPPPGKDGKERKKRKENQGYARMTINRHTAIIKRAFRRGVANRWVKSETYGALLSVETLKLGQRIVGVVSLALRNWLIGTYIHEYGLHGIDQAKNGIWLLTSSHSGTTTAHTYQFL